MLLNRGSCQIIISVRYLVRSFLTVGIKEGEDFSCSYASSQQPGCDEAFSLWLPDNTYDL